MSHTLSIIGNRQGTTSLFKWFSAIQENNKKIQSNLLITGEHGTGKTYTINKIAEHFNIQIEVINALLGKDNKLPENIITLLDKNRNIVHNIEKTPQKVVYVVEDVESIISSTNKKLILQVIKTNSINWIFPLILVSNNNHSKLVSDIKKYTIEIKFSKPDALDMFAITKRMILDKNILYANEEILHTISNEAQQDLKRLDNIVKDLRVLDKKLTTKIIDNYFETVKSKIINFDLFKTTELLLYDYQNIDKCLDLYNTEKVILPLMVHENYKKCLLNSTYDNQNSISHYITLAKLLSKADLVENYIYSEQSWDIQQIHGLYSCALTSDYLNIKHIKRSKYFRIGFSVDLNKTSIKNINKKNISNAKIKFPHLDINDIMYIDKILTEFLNNDDIQSCKDFLGENFSIETLQLLLKINKVNSDSKKFNITELKRKYKL